ncbi:MAG: tetratricopeptide repeat protein [Deltaproteobacteria bacterium]|nr:tetratricopeptide repeat protein [Deltaproteobacteria bacterium]
MKRRSPSPPPTPAPSDAPRRVPLWQAVVLPVAAVLVFFFLLEGAFALFGVKPSVTEDPFVGFAGNVPLFVPSPDGTQLVTAPNKLGLFNPQSFPRVKAPGTYRIFCMGESTTYGHPYTDPTSFAGWMRELLPVADAGKRWEVINTGGISYASSRVAHLMEELVRYQPDLFVIYVGQNEFLEERTYGKLRKVPTPVRKTVAVLSGTRTWAGMTAALKGLGIHPESGKQRHQLAGEVDAVLERSAGLERYTRDDVLRENVLEHYRISLQRMVEIARSGGAQVIFVTPATNLKDCTPFKSEHTAGLDPAARQRSEAMLAAAREAMARKDWAGALQSLDEAVKLDPRHAELLYRRGQALFALGRYDEAESVLRQARDEDVCPLRALTPIPRIVAEVAREEGAGLVDYVELLRARMRNERGHPILGQEYFLDHVHPSIEGYRILAVALIQKMAEQGVVQPGPQWGEPAIARVAAAVEGRIDRKVHGQALATLARTLLWAGKTEDAERLAAQALASAGEVQQIAVDSASILTTVYQRQGRPDRALQLLYSAIEKAPGAMELRLKLGLALVSPPYSQPEEAAANLLVVTQQYPQYDVAHELFGLALAKGGRLGPAYASLLEALRLNPNNVNARMTLAQVQSALQGQSPNPQLANPLLEIYPNITPRRVVQVRYDASGRAVPDGIEVEWHENGRIKRFLDVAQGVPNGLELTWDPGGRLLARKAYRK